MMRKSVGIAHHFFVVYFKGASLLNKEFKVRR